MNDSPNADHLLIPASVGELVDKITILEIKDERLTDPQQLENVRRELGALNAVFARFERTAELEEHIAQLRRVNNALWTIEDDIRDCERAKDFGERFVELARAVYVTNDERAVAKKAINQLTGSTLVEEKSYQEYT